MDDIVFVDSQPILLQRKSIRNLYIRVKPPLGHVTVSAPYQASDEYVMQFIHDRWPWVKEQQAKFFADAKPEPELYYMDGEEHWLWGKAYRLSVHEGYAKHAVVVQGDELLLQLRTGARHEARAALLDRFYREQIVERLSTLVPHWEEVMGLRAPEIRLRTMKTRWGSCRVDGTRIWLNTALAQKVSSCLEYVLVHEMVHLFEPSHNHRFKALMQHFMPDWRERKALLNGKNA